MITLITPTGDRPISFNLTIQYIFSQVVDLPIQWIVVDDGKTNQIKEVLNNNKTVKDRFDFDYIKRPASQEGPKSLANNLLEALPLVKGNYVSIIEDDDWYSPLYLHDVYSKLSTYEATGSIWQCYYNLRDLTFKVLRNRGSALCSTSFRSVHLPLFEETLKDCYRKNFKGIDYTFWESLKKRNTHRLIDEKRKYLCIGMKALPGRTGIGVGHEGRSFYADPGGVRLRDWVGENWAKVYLEIRHDMLRNRS